ncbi:MAG TPA: M23 family metallopeptidase [Asanoa sp.]|nr:M23 family metallopeptidase [Asanoa sp.]
MNWYAFRNAALSVLAIALVAVVATVVPAGSLLPPRDVGWGRAVGASGLRGIHQGAGVRGSPRGAVQVAFKISETGPRDSPLLRKATAAGPVSAGVAPEPMAAPETVISPAGRAPGSPFQPPVEPPLRVTRRFDAPPRPWLPGHRGVDLASVPGATVWAAGPGEVVFAGPVAGRSVVSIQHAGGLRTTYEPLIPVVRRGDQVAAGDPLGTLEAGHSGCPAAACLHWGLRRDAEYLDPLLLLGFRVRLLPL